MSKYHSICDTCGFEDPNDGTQEEDCGHPFWSIVEHPGSEDEDQCDFCLELWSEHSDVERISCERDLEVEDDELRHRFDG